MQQTATSSWNAARWNTSAPPGLRLFLTLRKQVAAKGGKLVIRNINESISEVFSITGFFNLFEIA